jgi:hypothetical protein
MKLMRYGAKRAERPALLDAQGRLRDLGAVVADITAQTLTPDGLGMKATSAIVGCNLPGTWH